jgi:flagellar hook-associated protein 2
MSINGSLSGITFGGLSSGMDTDGIINRLVQIETASIGRLQRQQAQLRQQADLQSALKGQITSIASAANNLSTLGTFNPIASSVSNKDVVSISTGVGSQVGAFDIRVSRLATAQKISSAGQTSSSDALNQTGSFSLNEKVVNVLATDSLRTIASKVNELGVGVTASVIDGGPNQAFLTFTSTSTGASGRPVVSDLTGSVLQNLGVVNGTTSIKTQVTNGAAGMGFNRADQAIGSMIGASGLSAQTIQVNGINVSINLQTDTLQGVADKINQAGTGATASVVTVTEGTTSKFRLEIRGTTTPTFTDGGNVLTTLGILQRGNPSELVAGQDAQYSIDGVSLTSSTNTVRDVIPGTTMTLLKANQTTPESATITLTNDADNVVEKVKSVVNAFNDAISFIENNSKFDSSTFETGPLFGDPTARQFQAALGNQLFNAIPGLTGTYRNLTDVGFRLGSDGRLSLDESKFKTALSADNEGVRRIFQNFGSSTTGSIQYVSSTSTSIPTTVAPYDINITQVATRTQWIAGTAKTGPNTASEKLTFSGNLFGGQSLDLMIDVGMNLTDIVAKINNDPRFKDNVTASINSGRLQVDSKKFGGNGQFNLVSNQSPLGTNSGVGFAPGTLTNGLDVQGTIAGQAATGVGQFLTGSNTNTVANGLQIQYTGTTTGLVGNINFTRGISGIINETLKPYTDFTNGLTVANEKSLRDQADLIQKDIDRIQERARTKANELRNKFSNMESQIARLQSQGSRIAQLGAQQVR